MNARTAANRFFDRDDLVLLAFQHLDRAEIIPLAPLLLHPVASVIYATIDFDRYIALLDLASPRKQTYLNNVRTLEVDTRDSGDHGRPNINHQAAGEIFTPAGVARVLEHCPNIITIRSTDIWDGRDQWILHPTGEGRGKMFRSVTREVPLDTRPGELAKLEPPEAWPGWELTYGIRALIRASGDGVGTEGQAARPPVMEWLMDFDNLDGAIHRLAGEGIQMSLGELREICESRERRGKRTIESLSWRCVKPFYLIDLWTLDPAASHIRELRLELSPRESPLSNALELPLLHYDIRVHFPNLERLSIPIANKAHLDHLGSDVDFSDLLRRNRCQLSKINIDLHGAPFVQGRLYTPWFHLAQALIGLGVRDCHYSIRTVCHPAIYIPSDSRPDHELTRLVQWVDALPPHRRDDFRRCLPSEYGMSSASYDFETLRQREQARASTQQSTQTP